MELKTYFAQDASGNIMPGATVTVYEAGTATLATGLQDESGSPLANPFTADSSAKVAFYAPDGLYDITVVGNGRTVTIRAQFVSVDGASVLRTDLAATGGAALVGFQQAGTGAVATTVQAKLRETVSVKDFGAVGNGVTDDTAAIQTAIDYIKSIGGGVLEFPYGNYNITSSVIVAGNFGYAGIKLVGNNSKIVSTGDAPAFLIDARNGGGGNSAYEYRINAVVDGFQFYGPGVASTSSVGVKSQYSANVLVKNCAIRNFYRGLQGFGTLISKFENLNISNNQIGIDFQFSTTPISFGANDNHFVSCRVWNNAKAIFYSAGSGGSATFDYCEIEGNNLESTGAADGVAVIDLYLCGKVTFNGCHIEENRGQYNIKYSSQDSTGSLNFIGTQFLLNGSTGYGIFLDNTVGVATSLAMVGCSIGTCLNSDVQIGTGYSVSLVNTPVSKPITGSLEKLTVLNGGKFSSGAYSATFAPMFLDGSANGNNIAFDFRGLPRFVDASQNRIGYLIHNGSGVALTADTGFASIGTNAGIRVQVARLGTGTFEPNADNTYSLGTASLRWGTVFAGTGTINTSDARAKQQIRSLNEQECAVAARLKSLVRAFKFNDAVEAKGDGARIHVGVIAQDVKAAFESEGLVAEEYAVLCHDMWGDYFEDVNDANGQPTGEKKLVTPAGDRYGVRYEQLLAFIISAL